ncbi:MAG: cob(I)yrinic acid a,c-diamide adenosyltransferase [Cyanobacteria bacterium P01_C01_bin.89]
MVSQVDTLTRTDYSPPLEEAQPHRTEGLVQVFTYPQRLFPVDTIAQAMRLAGHGTPVLLVQFLKGGINQGTAHPVSLVQNLDWIRGMLDRTVDPAVDTLTQAEIEGIQTLWTYVTEQVQENRYDVVVLDELSVAVSLGAITPEAVLEFLETRADYVDVIFNGPTLPDWLLAVADRVTEVRRLRP